MGVSIARTITRHFSRSLRNRRPALPSPQWIANCPEPTCDCQPTPPGLDIDYESPMTFAPYTDHVVVCTGQDDWASKIEMDTATGPVTRHLKSLYGLPRKAKNGDELLTPGKYHEPNRQMLITNASFASSKLPIRPPAPKAKDIRTTFDELPSSATSLYLFPSFEYVTIPAVGGLNAYARNLHTLNRAFIDRSDSVLHGLVSINTAHTISEQKTRLFPKPVHEVVVLICGHGGRDSRCGALGLPILKEFRRKLPSYDVSVLPNRRSLDTQSEPASVHVGLSSHIGGHKWAGNIVIYIPPTWKIMDASEKGIEHPLAGSAIWYGRVEPKHVEGIIQETIVNGRLVKELWRGGMQKNGDDQDVTPWDPIVASET